MLGLWARFGTRDAPLILAVCTNSPPLGRVARFSEIDLLPGAPTPWKQPRKVQSCRAFIEPLEEK